MASLIRMSCEILKIIQRNEIDEQILTLKHAFRFPLSSLRFLALLKYGNIKEIRQKPPYCYCTRKGKSLCLSRIRAQERAVSGSLNSLIAKHVH